MHKAIETAPLSARLRLEATRQISRSRRACIRAEGATNAEDNEPPLGKGGGLFQGLRNIWLRPWFGSWPHHSRGLPKWLARWLRPAGFLRSSQQRRFLSAIQAGTSEGD